LKSTDVIQGCTLTSRNARIEGGLRTRNAAKVSSQNNPLVTIITVSFNGAATLEQTICSVVGQSYSNIEHIIIDGGSTDLSLDILRKYDGHIDYWVSEKDAGIYHAMNKGLTLAGGDIICFLNADDMYAHENVLTQVANIMAPQGLDALFGDVVFFKSDSAEKVIRRYRSHHFHPNKIAYGWMPPHPALFVRHVIFDRVGKFREDYQIAGDFEFVVRAFRRSDLRYQYLPEILVKMRIGGVSTSGWRNRLLLNKEVLKACRENCIQTNILKILCKYPAKLLELFHR
jgi:glycosyltransferase involved in cell wall biosynthesis